MPRTADPPIDSSAVIGEPLLRQSPCSPSRSIEAPELIVHVTKEAWQVTQRSEGKLKA